MSNLGQANFGVPHRRSAVAVHRAEVALAVDQHVAQREILGHPHDGVVHRLVTVGVILTDHVTDDTRRFLVGFVPVVTEFVHGVEHSAMHGLKTIAHVGQRPPDDHAHRVIQVGVAHLVFEADGDGFFGERDHGTAGNRLFVEETKNGDSSTPRAPFPAAPPPSGRLRRGGTKQTPPHALLPGVSLCSNRATRPPRYGRADSPIVSRRKPHDRHPIPPGVRHPADACQPRRHGPEQGHRR